MFHLEFPIHAQSSQKVKTSEIRREVGYKIEMQDTERAFKFDGKIFRREISNAFLTSMLLTVDYQVRE